MKKVDLNTEIREEKGTREAGKLRRSGYLPAVLYGGSKETLSLKLDRKTLIPILHRIGEENVFINLKIKKASGGEGTSTQLAMLKTLQHNPVTDELIHLDFQRISLKEKIVTELYIVLQGEAPGVKEGGILDHSLRTIEVEALPQDMPDHLEVDISELTIGDTVRVSAIPVPPNVNILIDTERPVLSVLAPKVVEEIEEEIEEAVEELEPEVAGKEKKEGEVTEEGKEETKAEKPGAEEKQEKSEEPTKEKGKEKGREKGKEKEEKKS